MIEVMIKESLKFREVFMYGHKIVGIIGSGQLGRMTIQEARRKANLKYGKGWRTEGLF